MSEKAENPLKLFYCYAREDKAFRDELDIHLSVLKRTKQITSWSDLELSPGAEWQKEIDHHLNTAHIILLLISANFMASDYCYGIEMERALERHKAGTARVIPILLRPAYWQETPFSFLQVLPPDALPITQWHDRDEAFLSVTEGIRNVVRELQTLLQANAVEETQILWQAKEELLDKGKAHYNLKQYEEALSAYEEALRLDAKYANAWNGKGDVYYDLKRYSEALSAYEQALILDPNSALAWNGKSNALRKLKRYAEALSVYEEALRLYPNLAPLWNNKGIVLGELKRYAEALSAHEEALRLDAKSAKAWNGKGCVLYALKRYGEALSAYEEALRLDPNDVYIWCNKGDVLRSLRRYAEALSTYEEALRLDAKYVYAWSAKGVALRALRRNDEARFAHEQARRLDYSSTSS